LSGALPRFDISWKVLYNNNLGNWHKPLSKRWATEFFNSLSVVAFTSRRTLFVGVY
jgi:hypothetical protein